MMPRRVRFVIPLLAALVGLGGFAAACGDDDGGSTKNQLQANLSEWKITLDKATVSAGKLEIVAKNAGTTAHELVIIRTDARRRTVAFGT